MALPKRTYIAPLKQLLRNPIAKKTFSITSDDLALILSGGGARGAYQIGVWKAMEEKSLMPKVKQVYGTSVGAINGAAIVQGDLALAEKLWRQLDYSKVFSDFDTIGSSAEYKPRAIYQTIVKLFREKGLNVEPLKELLHEFLDEDRIRESPIEFGLVVFELNSFKKRYVRKEDIPEGELIDYIIGSATFPVFKPHYVDGKRFIDGGLVDNRPFSFLKNQDSIGQAICIDLTTARHFYIKDADQKDMQVNYLKASKLLGSPLAFDLNRINKNMALGYNDFHLYCKG